MPWSELHEEIEEMFGGLSIPEVHGQNEGFSIFLEKKSGTYYPHFRPVQSREEFIEKRRQYYQKNKIKLAADSAKRWAVMTPEQRERRRKQRLESARRCKEAMTPEQRAEWQAKRSADARRRWAANLEKSRAHHRQRVKAWRLATRTSGELAEE